MAIYAAVELGGMSIRVAISIDTTENIVVREKVSTTQLAL
jgi:predicted NBD/HSP70 family sugar kinase